MLAKNGFSIRVDHLTLKAQREEAERNGDTFLARILSRVPEEYVGVISCQDDDNPQLERLREFRALRKQHFDLVMKLEALTAETEELETKDAVQQSSTKARDFIATPKKLTQPQQELRAKMFTAVAEVNRWKRVVISYRDAQEQARLEYMNKTERELWQKYSEALARKKQLEEFLKNLRKPKETEKAELKAYEEVVVGVQTKISSLSTAVAMMRKSVEETSQRLDSPECRNNILLVTPQILRANTQAKKMLKQASDDLSKAVDDLQNAVFAQTVAEPKNIFKTREVYDIIRRQFFGLKKEHEKAQEAKFTLQRRIISPQRALAMA